MLSATGSPLVVGSAPPAMAATVRVRVERAFFLGKDVQPVGAEIEVPKHIAAWLQQAGKVSAALPPVPAIEAPALAPSEEPEPAPKAAPTRGKANARK